MCYSLLGFVHLVFRSFFTHSKWIHFCLHLPAGQVASLTETSFTDWMLGSCAGHHRLWPLTSPLFSTDSTNQTASSQRCHPLSAQWQLSSLAATSSGLWQSLPLSTSNYGAFGRKAAVHHCGRGLFRTKTVGSKKLILWKGNLPHNVFKALWIIPTLYNFGETNNQSSCSGCCDRFLGWYVWSADEESDHFWELDGWRTYSHDYCRTWPSAMPPQLLPPRSFFSPFLDF